MPSGLNLATIQAMTRHHILTILLAALILTACGRTIDTEATPQATDFPAATISGTLISSSQADQIAGRQIALCQVTGSQVLPGDCTVQPITATSDSTGSFTLEAVPAGDYLVLLDSGLSDFNTGLTRWSGQILHLNDRQWLYDTYIGSETSNLYLPIGINLATTTDRIDYAASRLMIGESPFILAYRDDTTPLLIGVGATGTVETTFPAPSPTQPDYATLRSEIAPISSDESTQLDPDLIARWNAFLAGDDTAYRDTDLTLIRALRDGSVYRIGGAYLTPIERWEGQIVKRIGYAAIDTRSGETVTIGWIEEKTGDLIEASTNYRLNLRDHTGTWIEEGPNGEQFYHYGFSYYQRWRRILPDPIIDMIKGFYSQGVTHIQNTLIDYQSLADTFGYDLELIDWDESTPQQVADWLPSETVPPYVLLPHSGTVDIRRERFREALDLGKVQIDEASLSEFLSSDYARDGYFMEDKGREDVVNTLLKPYRSGWLFNDLEALIILGATYDGDDPLVIRISPDIDDGVMVPSRRKEIIISSYELSDVIMGYPGVLNGRWAHEMNHVVDFQNRDYYTFRGRPPQGESRCEPAKYMMEYMWWVQRYPGDAPDWDWMPTASGLALARLLSGEYPNSGC